MRKGRFGVLSMFALACTAGLLAASANPQAATSTLGDPNPPRLGPPTAKTSLQGIPDRYYYYSFFKSVGRESNTNSAQAIHQEFMDKTRLRDDETTQMLNLARLAYDSLEAKEQEQRLAISEWRTAYTTEQRSAMGYRSEKLDQIDRELQETLNQSIASLKDALGDEAFRKLNVFVVPPKGSTQSFPPAGLPDPAAILPLSPPKAPR